MWLHLRMKQGATASWNKMERKKGGDRLVAVMLELWLHVLLRIFFGLTWVYLYCVVFEIFHVSELWLQVEGG